MKIAVCLSAQIRTGIDAAPNILNYLGDLLPDIDFFIHTWDKETISYCELNENLMLPNIFDVTEPSVGNMISAHLTMPVGKIDKFLDIYKPKKFKIDNQETYIQSLTRPGPSIWYYSNHEVNALKQEYERENNFTYDVVIATRPDLIFSSDKHLGDDLKSMDLNSNHIYGLRWDKTPINLFENICFTCRSDIIDISTNFINWDPSFFDTTDTQELHYRYLIENNILPCNIASEEFIVYRYYQKYLHSQGKSYDSIIKEWVGPRGKGLYQ